MARIPIGHAPNSDEAGFTLVEIVVVLLIAIILVDVAAGALVPARQAAGIQSAEYAFRSLHARTRAHAIERGSTVRLELDPFADRARIVAGADTLESFDFQEEYGVDVESRVGGSIVHLTQCMSSRGLGDGACTSFGEPAEITFAQGDRSGAIRLLPLGQVLD